MRAGRFTTAAAMAAFSASIATTDDYIYSDAFEQRRCDGIGCTYCSPPDPQPLCGTHSHCTPQPDASSLCTYPDGSGLQGASCSTAADCAGPYFCADTGAGSKCLHWCSRPGGTECTGGTTCVGFSTPALTGTQEWGVCM